MRFLLFSASLLAPAAAQAELGINVYVDAGAWAPRSPCCEINEVSTLVFWLTLWPARW